MRWLILVLLLGMAQPATAQTIPIPNLAKWESQMKSFGKTHCTNLQTSTGDAALASTYYDMTRVMLQITAYTGDQTWLTCAMLARTIYRDNYVIKNNGRTPGYWNFTTGMRMDFERSGDQTSRNTINLLAQNAGYSAPVTGVNFIQGADLSRETAYGLIAHLNSEALGFPPMVNLTDPEKGVQRRISMTNAAYGHFNQWFVDFCWKTSGPNCPAGLLKQFSPFMVGISAQALIREWERSGDSRLLSTLTRAADWLAANAWQTSDSCPTGVACGFFYDALNGGTGPGRGAPDLNMIIAPMYAFLYLRTGNVAYRDTGDLLFKYGVDYAWLGGAKQFNQNYWWSFDYVKWRGLPVTPPTIPVAPANLKLRFP